MFGRDKLGYASEHSVVDPEKKVMTMMSKNVSAFSCTCVTCDTDMRLFIIPVEASI